MDSTPTSAVPRASQPAAPTTRRRGFAPLSTLVLLVTGTCVALFAALLLRQQVDPGCRVWLLNHAPDQIGIIDPYRGVGEKFLAVSDGLRGLTFSRDGKHCYVFGQVDVTNKLTVVNTTSYLVDDTLELRGIPQGIAVFPNDRYIAMILGAKTDFMSGGFDVLDLKQRSQVNPAERVNLMRVRDLQLSHKIAVGDDGDRIYMIDAKAAKIYVYSLKSKLKVKEIDLRGAPEDFLYPPQGDYYYASVLQHLTIYQLRKDTDEIVAGYVYCDIDPKTPHRKPYLRRMAVDGTGRYLYGTCSERYGVAIWDTGNLDYLVRPNEFRPDLEGQAYPRLAEFPTYVPVTRFRISGEYTGGGGYIPQPQLIAVDPLDTYIFVVDEDGALYVFERSKVFERQPPTYAEPAELPRPSPTRMVTEMANDTAEIRDIAVSQPAVRRAKAGAP